MMKSLAVVVAFVVQSVYAAISVKDVPRETSANLVPNGFVVELSSQSNQLGRREANAHELFYSSLKKRGTGFSIRHEFNSPGLFVGTSLVLDDPSEIIAIAQTPGVLAVRPIVKVPAPSPVKKVIVHSKSDAAVPPDTQSSHVMISVDKLHAQGIFGKGIKVGIIDTGIDYTHPALGGAFGPGNKVIGGFDLVGDDYTGSNTPVPDPDPLDQCNGHGTHVAGIIGADPNNDFNISGIAFQASIASYRVFGCSGFVTDDVLVEALLRGNSDGMDILTMSLGGVDGWTESTSAVLSSRLSDAGKIVTIAAGNDGEWGSWYTSSPGNAIDAISVASADNTFFPVTNSIVGGVSHAPIPYFSLFPLPTDPAPRPIFATSTDTTVVDDACNPLPDSTPNLSKFVVIIRRGTCSFVQKLTNVAAKGGNLFLIYNNIAGLQGIDVGNFSDQAALITADDGAFLVQQFAAGAPITLAFPQTGAAGQFPDNDNGGLISSFTSFGPTFDMFFKPAVAAPGGNILSTFPVPLGSFAVLSGTSMATPATAASAALILSTRGKIGALALRNLLQTTAQPVASSKTDGDPFQTLSQQGAGLLNVFQAVHTTTIVTPGQLTLNDSAHFNPVQSFTIKNTGTTRKTFKLTHVPAGTMVSVEAGSIFPNDGPVPLSTQSATVTIVPSSVTLAPGQSTRVGLIFRAPSGVDASTFPVFSGWIVATSGSEVLRVSYLGVAAALKNKQVVDDTDFVFGVPIPAILDSVGDVQEGPTTYTFVGDDFPTLLWRLAFGSPSVLIDLVPADTTFKPTISARSFGFWSSWIPHRSPGGSFSRVATVGPLAAFPFIPRNNDDFAGQSNLFNTLSITPAQFANGTAIPNGQYKILFRALRVTGDPSNETDYESFLSPVIGVAVP